MGQIRFILGRAGVGKTTRCVDAAADALRAGGDGPLGLLTPEQATYQMELAVLSRPQVRGFSRLRVLSFNRLGFWLNRRLGTGADLSRLGRQMVVHRVLLEQAESLTLYRDTARHPGLAERLGGLLSELQQADCTAPQAAALAEQLEAQQPGGTTARKWRDIATVFAGYTAFFDNNSTDLHNPETQLTLARCAIANAPFIRRAHIWVDGFSGFTVQERELLIEMARHCECMHIALCLDPATLDLDNTDPNVLDPAGLFYATEQTYAELLGIFRKCRFTIDEPEVLSRPRRYGNAAALAHIEAHLVAASAPQQAGGGAVEVVCCPDVRAEAEWTAGRICELVRQQGYRYRQIAVAVPEMEVYAAYLESAFARCEIPCFVDRPAAVRHHPLAETLQAALAAAEQFCTMDILCYLKSGLAGVATEYIERLERYCLTYGIEREDWTGAAPWGFAGSLSPDEDAAMQSLRQGVIEPLHRLHTALFSGRKAIEAGLFVRAVWNLLEQLDARTTLAAWAQQDPTDAQGHRQTWAQLTTVLDEIERVFAGRAERAEVFVSTLANALASLTIKLIPPTLDQVLIGSIERSRHPDIRAMFLVGTTQKQFPSPLSTTDILGRSERQAAQTAGLELAEPMHRQLSMRHYLAYIALTRASEYLAVSYPQQDEKGAPLVPSVWIDRLGSLFSDVWPRAACSTHKILQSQSTAELAERLAAACGKDRAPQAQTDGAAYALNAALGSSCEAIRATGAHVVRALRYDNVAELANTEALGRLKQVSSVSASRLGTFAACPYQHFAKYVLNLKKRTLLKFEPVDMGDFYHTVIERLFVSLQQRRWSWATAPSEELAALCERTLEAAIEQNPTMTAFMRRQMHHRYIVERACDTLRRFVPALAELERAGAFGQVAAELDFSFPLSGSVSLKGRIDRLDVAEVDGRKVAAIYDFKLSPRSLNWSKLFYGLDIQLLTYLLAVRSLPDRLRADAIAGAFYLPIEWRTQTIAPDKIEKEKENFAHKAAGLFDGAFAETLDAAARGWSRYYNFYVGKDGEPFGHYGSSGAVRSEDFSTLLAYAKQTLIRLAEAIRGGTITVRPFRLGKTTPCGWCDYKSLCRFDWQINDYNALAPVDKDTAIERMTEQT